MSPAPTAASASRPPVSSPAHGGRVLLTARSEAKGRRRSPGSRPSSRTPLVEHGLLDLADLDSVRAFAERSARRGTRIDVLVNNAGVMFPPRVLSPQGNESQFATNHLGPLRPHRAPLRHHRQGPRRPGRHRLLARAQGWLDPLRRPDRGAFLLAEGLLPAVEIRQRAVRSRARPPPVQGRRPRPLGAGPSRLDERPICRRAGRPARETGHAARQPAARPEAPRSGRSRSSTRPWTPPPRAGTSTGRAVSASCAATRERCNRLPPPATNRPARRLWEVSEELTGVTYRF